MVQLVVEPFVTVNPVVKAIPNGKKPSGASEAIMPILVPDGAVLSYKVTVPPLVLSETPTKTPAPVAIT
jgi:hypothetical protein